MRNAFQRTVQFAAFLLLTASVGAAGASPSGLVERGNYLMNGILACGHCHAARGSQGEPLAEKGLSGGAVFEEKAFKAYASNITQDRDTGIGKWSDADIVKVLREGVRPDGSVVGPPMPVDGYRRLSDDDMAAVVAVLRSAPPVSNRVPKSIYRMPLPPNYGPPLPSVAAPSPRDQVRYGEYLSTIGHCTGCHTQRDEQGRLKLAGFGAGGRIFTGPWGASVARNLTPHASGLKDWSDAEIVRAVRDGVGRDGVAYKPPMPFAFFKHIDDADMAALTAYLRALPALPFGGP